MLQKMNYSNVWWTNKIITKQLRTTYKNIRKELWLLEHCWCQRGFCIYFCPKNPFISFFLSCTERPNGIVRVNILSSDSASGRISADSIWPLHLLCLFLLALSWPLTSPSLTCAHVTIRGEGIYNKWTNLIITIILSVFAFKNNAIICQNCLIKECTNIRQKSAHFFVSLATNTQYMCALGFNTHTHTHFRLCVTYVIWWY